MPVQLKILIFMHISKLISVCFLLLKLVEKGVVSHKDKLLIARWAICQVFLSDR